ncbi:MAG: type II toxin-antitoxin system Phd/YefM family antitoxin [Deltaproteobacteria bacterium]|nr:type II toxin-antitoxin system Phd/YefM family antitoxin [Deltaproteobacteria bacterium]
MAEALFSKDVRPITDFKAKGSAIVEQARSTGRPVLITQRGRGVAVVVGLEEYERMREELAFVRAVEAGLGQARKRDFAPESTIKALLTRKRR